MFWLRNKKGFIIIIIIIIIIAIIWALGLFLPFLSEMTRVLAVIRRGYM